MADLQDLGVAAGINILTTFLFLVAFAFLKLQPANDRVYYPKWYIKGVRKDTTKEEQKSLLRYVNLNYRPYLHFLDWMRDALRMPEAELIEHAGLDSAVYLRIYILGLKIFVPLMLLGFLVLVPVNVTDTFLSKSGMFSTSVDNISLSNVKAKSQRLWVHLVMTYVFTGWTCFMLYIEYQTVAAMRFRFLAAEHRRPDQFTVLVRQIPADPDERISTHIDHFFRVNHPDYYLSHQVIFKANKLAKLVKKKAGLQNWLDYYQLKYSRNSFASRPMTKTGWCGLWGAKVDAIEHYSSKIEELAKEAAAERERVLKDDKAKMPVAFVSFKARWGAAVCAQTQQSKDPTTWLTEWAPEPRDVYWKNLSVPYLQLSIRKLIIVGAVFLLIFFFVIPIAFVQSLASLEGIEKKLKFLKPIIETKFIKSFLQGFLPGLALKLFLIVLPKILMFMSKIEGHLSLSKLEVSTSAKYYYFMVVNVFFASILAGAAFEQLQKLVNGSLSSVPGILANSIPIKATFFITFIMVDGWSGVAGEILRLKPLIIYHLKNMFLVKTEKDRENAMSPGSAGFDTTFPQLELYFLLGTVYAIITPFILPFIVVYFAFGYVVYRHQVINVYDPEYESAAAFWPHIHNRIIASILIEQVTLLGVFTAKRAALSTPFLIGLPILTIVFHLYCKNRFEPAFRTYPLEEAMSKDIVDKAMHPNWNIRSYLENAYMHPVFKNEDEEDDKEGYASEEPKLIPTKRAPSQPPTPGTSVNGGGGESPVAFPV